jgi:hypothetical protein
MASSSSGLRSPEQTSATGPRIRIWPSPAIEMNRSPPPRHRDGDLGVDQAEPVTRRGHGAAARPGGQSVPGPPLPDLGPDGLPRQHLDELDVGPIGERGVGLDFGTQATHVDGVEVGDHDHAVGIADRDRGHGEPLAVDLDRIHRAEPGRAHVRHHLRDTVAIASQPHRHRSARRLHDEGVLGRVPMLAEELGEDADPVPALLGLAPVGVQDAQTDVGRLGRHDQQDPSEPTPRFRSQIRRAADGVTSNGSVAGSITR